jgi:hypothetical protein
VLRSFLVLVVLAALALVVGCTQISSPDESIRIDRAATTTANISDSISSTTLNPTLLTEGLRVQAAMDLWMAESDQWPDALEEPNGDLSATEPALAPTYLKVATLTCKYTWDSQGHTEQHC